MSHVAIAAALALEDVSAGERLAAFSLASFANREHRGWPGTPLAAARAGLSRSQYLAARESLERQRLVVVEATGGGRGHSPVLALTFAHAGPWIESEINAPLFEAVLSYSRTRGSARLLLAALAALADEDLRVAGVATEELRAAAALADSTYRRARAALLACGELVLGTAGGGRARTNSWQLLDPRGGDATPVIAQRPRVAPPRTAQPLIATVTTHRPADLDAGTGTTTSAAGGQVNAEAPGAKTGSPAQIRTASPAKGPGLSGVSLTNPAQNRTVSAVKGPGLSGVSARNPGQSRTVWSKTPPNTPSETPPPNARTGREPQNPRTFPPNPPMGGHAGQVTIVEDYLTDRGRRRQRTVTVELDAIGEQLQQPCDGDVPDWQQIRAELTRIVGPSTFEIWLDQVKLAAVRDGCLLLTAPAATRSWIASRFALALERAGESAGRQLRLADHREHQLLDALAAATTRADTAAAAAAVLPDLFPDDHREVV